MKNFLKLGAAALLLSTLSACLIEDDKKTNVPENPIDTSGVDSTNTNRGFQYVIGVTSSGEEGTDYLFTVGTLDSGTISASRRGIEQTGWRYMGAADKHFLSIGYYVDNNFIAYVKDSTKSSGLREKGRFAFPVTLDILGGVDTANFLAIEIPRKGFVKRTLFHINLTNVSVKDTAIHEIWESRVDSLGAQPVSMVHRDGKIYVAFYPIHARGDFSTPQTDTSFVAIFSYPGLNFEKIIKDGRGGALGMYGNSNALIKTASNKLYSYSCASRACFTSDTTVGHSKILRINSGATEFDAAYEWDFQQTTGKKLTWFASIGGELAIGRAMNISALELAGKVDTSQDWLALGTDLTQELYILNLETKEATKVTGVPPHGGEYGTNAFVENGKVYMNIVTATDTYIYVVDIASKTGAKGARIRGAGVKMIAK